MVTVNPKNTTMQMVQNIEDPVIQAYRLGLLDHAKELYESRLKGARPEELDYKVVPLSPAEAAGVYAAQTGIGAFQPFLQQGERAIQGGQNILRGAAMPALNQAFYTTGGGQNLINMAALAARGVGAFNPYEEQVVQQAMQDIARQSGLEKQRLRAQAVGSNAFGGSRQAVAEQELFRNALEQMGRTSGQLRQSGFDASRARRLQEAQTLGSLAGTQTALGQGLGSLASQYGQTGLNLGQLGVQQAGIGELGQNLRGAQVGQALQAGAIQRGVQQAAMDAARLSNVERMAYPMQQLGFYSDVLSGIPSTQSTLTASSAPQVSPFQSALGLGVGALSAFSGARQAGIL
tara:strand:+ start:1550 stop:2590 length:1041 start_codon:yes stop_codon:yes gene_type:complete